MYKEVCETCRGKGKVRGEIDWFTGVFTGGLTALMDLSHWITCKICEGKGYQLRRD